jgi:hypothetical protein
VQAELRHARDALEALYGGALEKLACEHRNGILVTKRRIRALETALGEAGNGHATD